MERLQVIYLIAGVSSFIGAVIANLIYTDHELKNKSVINHWHDWWVKALSSVPSVVLFALASGNISSLTLRVLLPTIMVMVWFITWFDGLHGLAVDGDFFYTGTATGKNAALSDRFFRWTGRIAHIIIKTFYCSVTLYLYIKLL